MITHLLFALYDAYPDLRIDVSDGHTGVITFLDISSDYKDGDFVIEVHRDHGIGFSVSMTTTLYSNTPDEMYKTVDEFIARFKAVMEERIRACSSMDRAEVSEA